MSLVKKILITVFVVILAVGTLLFFEFKKINTPTTGPRISSYADPAKALMVIDVQDDYTGVRGRKEPIFKNVDNQIAKINKLIDKASSLGRIGPILGHLFYPPAFATLGFIAFIVARKACAHDHCLKRPAFILPYCLNPDPLL